MIETTVYTRKKNHEREKLTKKYFKF